MKNEKQFLKIGGGVYFSFEKKQAPPHFSKKHFIT